MLELDERVNHLDELMAQLIQTVAQTSKELREFKEEMRQSRERSEREMFDFKAEMRLSRERSEQEMLDFKAEMREFKCEMREFKREMRQEWGKLNEKLGTMAEDLVAPNVPRILREVTHCTEEPDFLGVRIRRKQPQTQEFDVVAVCGDYILINETKSNLKLGHIDDFCELMQKARDYFPEFGTDKKFIGAIASLYVNDQLVNYGEKQGLIVLGFGEDVMDVLNTKGFVPKTF